MSDLPPEQAMLVIIVGLTFQVENQVQERIFTSTLDSGKSWIIKITFNLLTKSLFSVFFDNAK